MNIYRAWDKQQNKMRYDITGFECDNGLIEGVFLDGDYYSLIGSCGHPHADIEQYTGLTDKNGAKIFEGMDIEGNLFNRRLPIMGKVIYDTAHTCFALENEGGITPLTRVAEINIIHEGDK